MFIRIFLLILTAASMIQAVPVTVESVFDGTYVKKLPDSYVWESGTSHLYWVEEGVLRRLDPAEGKSVQVALHEDLKGETIDGFTLVPGGKGLLLTSEESTYWQTADSELLKLPEGEVYTPAPDGESVAYLSGENIHLIKRDGGVRHLTEDGGGDLFYGKTDWVYGEELDLSRGFWFSPDSSTIAFLKFNQGEVPRHPIIDDAPVHPTITYQAYPQPGDPNALVEVMLLNLESGTAVNVASSGKEGYICRVSFSHDGGALYILEMNRSQTECKLVRVDIITYERTLVLTESDDHWVNIEGKIHPLPDGGILWTSERSGYRHLYLYGEEGKQEREITTGKWSVTRVNWVAPSGKEAIITATDPTPRERHAYLVDLESGKRTRLTGEEGWHSLLLSQDGKHFLDRQSSYFQPQKIYIVDRIKKTRSLLAESATDAFSSLDLPQVTEVTIPTGRGYNLDGLLIKSPALDETRSHPVLHYVYGGPHAQVTSNGWRSSHLWFAHLADKGFVIFMLDNRGSGGYGKAWENHLLKELGSIELADQLSGIAYLETLPYIDPERIGMWGWSYGGYMVLYALTHCDNYALGMAVAPVTDWLLYDSIYTERYLKSPEENGEGYKKSSPVHLADQVEVPLLIAHGLTDQNVHVQNSFRFFDSLIENATPYRALLYPGKGHSITGKKDRVHLFTALTDFLTEHLLGKLWGQTLNVDSGTRGK